MRCWSKCKGARSFMMCSFSNRICLRRALLHITHRLTRVQAAAIRHTVCGVYMWGGVWWRRCGGHTYTSTHFRLGLSSCTERRKTNEEHESGKGLFNSQQRSDSSPTVDLENKAVSSIKYVRGQSHFFSSLTTTTTPPICHTLSHPTFACHTLSQIRKKRWPPPVCHSLSHFVTKMFVLHLWISHADTHAHTDTHTHIHTHRHTHRHTHTHTHTIFRDSDTQAHAHTPTLHRAPSRLSPQTHRCAETYLHTRILKHSHTHTLSEN
jgi:hypothetical protein